MDDSDDNDVRDQDRPALAFGPFTLHRGRQLLLNGSVAVRLGSRAFALLVDLVEHAGQLRTRQQLEARIWPHSIVEETSLRVHMSALRRALGDGGAGLRYIDNLPGCGYVFVAPVTVLAARAAAGRVAIYALAPGALVRLVGRAADLDSVASQLAQRRLVSIIGPGGVGKTALALAVADRIAPQFADGVCLVDLSAVSDAQQVAQAVAMALALAPAAGDGIAPLCRSLEGRRMLVVLDNCEHVVDGVACLATALLRANGGLRLLATSREPLDAEGEWVHVLAALAMPDQAQGDPALALGYAAIELFVERARAKDDRFVLGAANAAAVCTLCQYLDGLPLAIELAAARVDSMGVDGLLASIGSLLGMLTRPRRTARASHRTLEAMLSWSHALLDDAERTVLRRCAVFCAGFSIEAAVAVCTDARLDADAVGAAVLALASKSLLMRSDAAGGMHFRLLYLTRTYALARLADSGEAAALAARHARHVATALDAMAPSNCAPGRIPWEALHGRATDDIRAAIDWAFSEGGDSALGLALAANAIHSVVWIGQQAAFGERLEQAMATLDRAPGRQHALTLCVYSTLVLYHGHARASSAVQSQLVARLRTLIDEAACAAQRAYALYCLCSHAFGSGAYRLVQALARELDALGQAEHDAVAVAVATRFAAYAHHYLGEQAQARVLCLRLLDMPPLDKGLHAWSPIPHAVSMRVTLARIAWIEGRSAHAALLAYEALALADQQHPMAICMVLAMASIPVALWRGDNAYAAQLVVRLHDMAERFQLGYWQGWARSYAQALARRAPPWTGELAERIGSWCGPVNAMEGDTLATVDGYSIEAVTLARAADGSAGWCAAEVLRARAAQRLREDGCSARAEAEALLARALALARAQHALAWELRIACTRLQCWRGDTREETLREALRGVLLRFPEGEATADQRAAAALLSAGAGAAPRAVAYD